MNPLGVAAAIEADPDVALLKSSADLVKAIEMAVRFYENPPAIGMTVGTPWSDIAEATGDPEAWTAFGAIVMECDEESRGEAWAEFLTEVADNLDHIDDYRPALDDEGYDPVLARATEDVVRRIRGLLVGNPACLPR